MMIETSCSKRWQVAEPAPEAFLARWSSIHPVVAQILFNRGFTESGSESETRCALLDVESTLCDPLELFGIDTAVPLIREIATRGESVVVYGDYDVDGVTAVAVLVETLRALGANVKPYIPSREDEGYGLNAEAIRTLVADGAALLITVDCGTRALDEIALARELGMHVVVTDHHQAGAELPEADVVINPKQPGTPPAARELAGVGVAFKLAQALLADNRRALWQTTQTDLSEEDLLDLVALGTVADMVNLLGENHTLVARGLACINAGHRPGLSALMRVAGIDPGKVTTRTIGFVLAPRLNAAGRIDEAMTALKLLLAPDMAAALPLAEALDELNLQRREITLAVREKAREMVMTEGRLPPLIFAASREFPSGVVGLAASRLLDEFYRPSVVISVEDEVSKGSARSIPEFHITEALDQIDGLLERHGGHAAAAGFTIKTSRIEELRSRLLALAEEKLGELVLTPTLSVDAEISLGELSQELYEQMEKLQPFGFGNPAPVLVSRRVRVASARAVGADGRHLKLSVEDPQGRSWDAIAFRQGHWMRRGVPPRIDLAYTVEENEWRGRVNLQLNVHDLRPSGIEGS